MELHSNAVAAYLHTRPRSVLKPKPAGRPRKRTPEHLAAVLRGHAQMMRWFIDETGAPPSSDRELLTAFRLHVQQECGTPMTEGQEVHFSMGLKTALNVLGQARAFRAANPENPLFNGVDSI